MFNLRFCTRALAVRYSDRARAANEQGGERVDVKRCTAQDGNRSHGNPAQDEVGSREQEEQFKQMGQQQAQMGQPQAQMGQQQAYAGDQRFFHDGRCGDSIFGF